MAVIYPEDCCDHCHYSTTVGNDVDDDGDRNNTSCTTTSACHGSVGKIGKSPLLASKLRRMKRKLLLEFVNQEQQIQSTTTNNKNGSRPEVDEAREQLFAQLRNRGKHNGENNNHDSSFSPSSSSTRIPTLLRLSSSSTSSSAFSSSSLSSSSASPMVRDDKVVTSSASQANQDFKNADTTSSKSRHFTSRVSMETRKQQRMKRKMMVEYSKATEGTNRLNAMFYALWI